MALPKCEHPTYTMTLPSTKEQISFRPYLVKEEKILLLASESDDEQVHINALKQILNNCILTEDFDVDEMSIFDFHHAFLELRAKSVGETVELKVICKNDKCNHPNDYGLKIHDIFTQIPEDFEYKINLNKSMGVVMRFPRVGFLSKLTKDNEKIHDYLTVIECVKEIYTDAGEVFDPADEPLEEQIAWIESLNAKESEKIKEWTKSLPEVSHSVKFNCSECGTKNERLIGGVSDFF